MPFQKNHALMGDRPKGAGSVKRKYLAKWEEEFEATNPIEKLKELTKKDYAEFIRLGLAAMPKDHNVDMNVNIFEGRSREDLLYFAEHGHWPEEG